MTKIVVDTNIIAEGDWHLRGPIFGLIEEAVERQVATLVVPEVVVAETVNRFRLKLESARKKR